MSNEIRLRCPAMTEDQALWIEEFGDDLSPDQGFLRRDEHGEFFLSVDESRLGPLSSDYSQSYARFLETYESYFQEEDDVACVSNPPLRIVTVNAYLLVLDYQKYLVHSPDPEKRLLFLAKWLKEQDADVILIQEANGKDVYDQLQTLVWGEEGFGVYVGDFSDLMVLSRHPIIEHHFLRTRWQGSEHERCQLLTYSSYVHGFENFKIDFHGQEVFIVNAHPFYRRSHFKNAREPADVYTPERLENLLEAWVAYHQQFQTQPAIFAGDFNFSVDNEEYRFFDQLFGLTNVVFEAMSHRNYQGAFSTYTPDNEWVHEPDWGILDHVFVNRWVTPLTASIVDPPHDFSDHFPVVASVHIENPISGEPDDTIPVSLTQIRDLIQYFEHVDLDWVCDVSWMITDGIRNQVSATLVFLRKLEEQLSPPDVCE